MGLSEDDVILNQVYKKQEQEIVANNATEQGDTFNTNAGGFNDFGGGMDMNMDMGGPADMGGMDNFGPAPDAGEDFGPDQSLEVEASAPAETPAE